MSLDRKSAIQVDCVPSAWRSLIILYLIALILLISCSFAYASDGNASKIKELSFESYPLLVLIEPSDFQGSAGDILNISYLALNNGNYTIMNVTMDTEESGPVELNKSVILPGQVIGGMERVLLNNSDFSQPITRNVEVSATDPFGKIITFENSTSIELQSRE